MSISKTIQQRLSKKGPDSYWSYQDFSDLPPLAVAQTLSRLSKRGRLIRARKGIYYYPKQTVLGPSVPNTDRVVGKMFGWQSQQTFLGGSASFYNLGLSTQVPVQYSLLSESNRKKINVCGTVIKVVPRKFFHLKNAKQQDVWLLEALRHLKHVPDSTPAKALDGIVQILKESPTTLKRLAKFAYGEPPRSRALIGALAEHLGMGKTTLKKIRSTVNLLSKYRFDVEAVLPNASDWGIVA